MTVGLFSNPNCAGAEEIQWSISDPSVFKMQTFGAIVELDALKQGSAILSATVNGQTVKLTVTTDPETQTMTEGTPAYLYLRGEKPAATFTPSESGKYEMKLVPHLLMEDYRMRILIKDPVSGCIYDNYQLSKDTTVTLDLVAGTKYNVVLESGIVDVTFTKVGSTPMQTDPTASTEASQQPTQSTQSTQNGAATPPTQNTVSPTSPSQNPTEPLQGTEPVGTEQTSPLDPTQSETKSPENGVSKPITQDDVTQAIENAEGNVISFSNTSDAENRTFQISADALQLAVEKGLALSLEFPANVNVQLGEDILKSINGISSSEDILISVTPQPFSALNESQQKAMDGWGLGWLLDMELTVGGKSIHELGGKAQITFPNKDVNEDWTVLYLAEDGTVEVMDITCDENITFSTEHFSHYALVWQEKQAVTQNDGGSNGWIAIPIVLIILAGGGTAAFFILKKKGLIPFKK